jgi:ParB-like chromosome segregation protein Spo0J
MSTTKPITDPKEPTPAKDWTKLEHHSLLGKLSIEMMPEDDIKHLKETIHTLGLQVPIVLFEDKILDGRNRYKACLQLGQESKFKFEDKHFVQYPGADPLEFVMSMYVDNRQQNESQRALVAATLVNTTFGSNQWHKHIAVSEKDAARMAKVSVAQIKIAKDVMKRACPELIKKVREGEKRLGYANGLIGSAKSPVSKEDQKKELEKPPTPRDSNKSTTTTTKRTTTPAVNQKQVELEAFRATWRNFNEMQKRAFVEGFKDELTGYLDYINQQQALLSPTEAPSIQPVG